MPIVSIPFDSTPDQRSALLKQQADAVRSRGVNTKPGAPRNLLVTPGIESLTVTFTPPPDDTGIVGYRAYSPDDVTLVQDIRDPTCRRIVVTVPRPTDGSEPTPVNVFVCAINAQLIESSRAVIQSTPTSTDGITSISGDGTASGPGAVSFTLSNVNANVGTFTKVTVNAKGLVTAAQNIKRSDIPFPIASKLIAYTVVETDYLLLGDATFLPFTITLPASPTAGMEFRFKKIDASVNAVTISGGTHNIDGTATLVLSTQYQHATVVYDGSVWWVV